LDEGKLRIFGNITPIDLEVEQFSLSNHAGQKELASFARACAPRHVVIFHADQDGRKALSTLFAEEMKVHLPNNRVEILLE
jgi:Cft2 family RNA processing exonuclease